MLSVLDHLLFSLQWWWEHSFWPAIGDLAGFSPKATLAKLVSSKEDEIWHAALFGDDGEVRRILKGLTNGPEAPDDSMSLSDIEAAGPSSVTNTEFQEAVEAVVEESYLGLDLETPVQARIKDITDQLANTRRVLTIKEMHGRDFFVFPGDAISILWIAIERGHPLDVDYLLKNHNPSLHTPNTRSLQTVLHKAVWREDPVFVSDILTKSSSSPSSYINVGDFRSRTPLHGLISWSVNQSLDESKVLWVFDLLYEYGANIDVLDYCCMTPLHLLLSEALRKKGRKTTFNYAGMIALLDRLVSVGAEVNTKDTEVENGADLETLGCDRKTPKQVFLGTEEPDKDFGTRMLTPSPTRVAKRKKQMKIRPAREEHSSRRLAVCHKIPVYCRYQLNVLNPDKNGNTFRYWAATDKSVHDVLFENWVTSLEDCETEFQTAREQFRHRESSDPEPSGERVTEETGEFQPESVTKERTEINDHATLGQTEQFEREMTMGVQPHTWKWMNFPANNITWIKDFIASHHKASTSTKIDPQTWQFFQNNTRVHETNEISSRVRIPHARSDLHEVFSADGLVRHIVLETVTFLDEFKWAGLGEHVLDVFESELVIEADKEARFFSNFTKKDWRSQYSNVAIHEAAQCTWLVKDIRDELRLIRKVFEQQLEVVKDFFKIHPTLQDKTSEDCSSTESFRETFVRDCGLDTLIQRVKHMDEDAAATLEGACLTDYAVGQLSNITQAMQAQASLKEAESARLMNFILLPFTVVTVIFTPLSFMTSLFAVNSDGFPHNEDGELRIPSGWFWRRMGKFIFDRDQIFLFLT
ncbi:hypothetical protein FDECE_18288 [Fusarium decemcellulare]|nr:hypothetical protein FDECE_18288 [Fusarium decemcellulare]